MEQTIYLDYVATTPTDPTVVHEMFRYLGPEGVYGNPASRTHRPGQEAAEAIEQARECVAELIQANPENIVWTSGATESINLAIKGVAQAYSEKGRHIVTSCLEHSAVLDTCRHLENKGCDITLLTPDSEGMITPECVRNALRDDTVLVSLIMVNNEVGTITDINSVGEIAHEHGVAYHIDAVQGCGTAPFECSAIQRRSYINERTQNVRAQRNRSFVCSG